MEAPARQYRGPVRNGELAALELTRRGPQTREELAGRLGIDETTVSRAITRLNEANDHGGESEQPAIFPIEPGDAQLPAHIVKQLESGSGRTPEVMMLGRRAGLVAGIEIGQGHLCVGIGDPNACLLGTEPVVEASHSIDLVQLQDTARTVATMLKRQLEHCGAKPSELRGVAVSIPSPVDKRGRTLAERVLPHYSGANVAGEIALALRDVVGLSVGTEVIVENDVDILARGEQRYGKAFELRDFVVVKCSAGIGSAVVSNEMVVRGRRGGGAGEIGHCPIKPHSLMNRPKNDWVAESEPKCRCGRWGHLEAYAGGEAILKRLERSEADPDVTDPAVPITKRLDLAMKQALAGEEPYERVFGDAAALIGLGVNSMIHLFNPERVLITGKLTEMGQPFLEGIQAECNAHGSLFGAVETIVELGSGSNTRERRHIGIRGAVATALRHSSPRLQYA